MDCIVVEDNASYAEDVAEFLVGAGHAVRIAPSVDALWRGMADQPAAIVLLDLGLPDGDGFDAIPKLRQFYPDCGLLVLTARVSLDSRIQGLRLGADAYLTKPIKFPELLANIEAVGRRVLRSVPERPATPWRLKVFGRRIELLGKGSLALSDKEFGFLHLLAQSLTPVPRDALLVGMGETNDLASIRRLDMLAYRLRKKVRTAWDVELPLRSSYGGGFGLAELFELD
jgi:DNA-binding response OmpR family regulator